MIRPPWCYHFKTIWGLQIKVKVHISPSIPSLKIECQARRQLYDEAGESNLQPTCFKLVLQLCFRVAQNLNIAIEIVTETPTFKEKASQISQKRCKSDTENPFPQLRVTGCDVQKSRDQFSSRTKSIFFKQLKRKMSHLFLTANYCETTNTNAIIVDKIFS